MTTRRGFMRLMGMTPIAAKAAADKAIADIANGSIDIGGLGGFLPTMGDDYGSPGEKQSGWFDRVKAMKLACRIPELAQELETHLYESFHQVTALDFDIANKRSFSLAAKIAYQRQRNVERERNRHADGLGMLWQRENELLERIGKKALGL